MDQILAAYLMTIVSVHSASRHDPTEPIYLCADDHVTDLGESLQLGRPEPVILRPDYATPASN